MKDLRAQIEALEQLLSNAKRVSTTAVTVQQCDNAWQLYRRIGVGYWHQMNRAEMRGREVAFTEGGIAAYTTHFPLFV